MSNVRSAHGWDEAKGDDFVAIFEKAAMEARPRSALAPVLHTMTLADSAIAPSYDSAHLRGIATRCRRLTLFEGTRKRPRAADPFSSSASTTEPKGPEVPQVNPDILRWARETAGLTREDAARKLAIPDTKTAMAVDRLRAMEDGERPPTRPMLSRMAKQYHRPLVAFYLSQPPRRANWGRDFRAPSTDRSARDEAVLDALVRNVQARQGLLRSAMLDDDDDLAPLRFLGSATIDTPVARVVAAIRDTLGLQPVEFRAASNPDEAFRLLRSHAERAGIFVLLLGNLGSYHTDLDVEVFRGFALLDDFAPFVVVNPKDSAGARSFTLLHELAHLWLREPGVSAGDPTHPVEVYCNRVASSFLLPHNELAALRTVGRKRERQLLAERDSGPAYGVLVRHSLGSRLIDLTFRLEASGSLTATKVGRVLGVNPRNAHTEAWTASEGDGRPPRLAQVGRRERHDSTGRGA